MKTLKNKLQNFGKLSIFIGALMLLSLAGFSRSHVTMTLKNITTTSNTIEYDLFIINDGCSPIKLSACSYGVNFDEKILNGGSITYSYKQSSRAESLNGLTSFSMKSSKVKETYQVRMTTATSKYDIASELTHQIPFKIGRFKITNSVSWAKNSNPSFSLQEQQIPGLTTTQILGYIGTDTKIVALTPSLTTVTTKVEDSPILNPSENSTVSAVTNNNNASTIEDAKLISDANKVKMYPNPVPDILKVDFLSINENEITLNVFDMNGRLVKQILTHIEQGINKIEIDMSTIAKGNYSILISDGKEFNFSEIITKE
jgi:hypothetical protein